MGQVGALGAAGDHQVVDEQHRAFVRHHEGHRLARRGGVQGIADPGHGDAEIAGVEVGDVALAVDVAQVRAQGVQGFGAALESARRAAGEVAALVVEQHGEGFVGGVQQADAALAEARALLGVEQQAPAMGQRAAEGLLRLRGVHRQADGAPEVGHGMLVVRVHGGQLAQQLPVQMLAIGQPVEVQGLQATVPDQPGQVVVGGHRDVDGLARGQRLVELLRAAEGVVFDADAGLLPEVLEHLRGDVVVPVVHADQVFGLGQRGQQCEQQRGEQAGHDVLPGMSMRVLVVVVRVQRGSAGRNGPPCRVLPRCRYNNAGPGAGVVDSLTRYAGTSCTRGRRWSARTPPARFPCRRRRCRCNPG
ncbi:hypothetical protein FQZ97_534300 [compost metagenome]